MEFTNNSYDLSYYTHSLGLKLEIVKQWPWPPGTYLSLKLFKGMTINYYDIINLCSGQSKGWFWPLINHLPWHAHSMLSFLIYFWCIWIDHSFFHWYYLFLHMYWFPKHFCHLLWFQHFLPEKVLRVRLWWNISSPL